MNYPNYYLLDGNYGYDHSKNIAGELACVQTDQGENNFKIVDISLYKYMGASYARTTLVLPDKDYEHYFSGYRKENSTHYTGLKFDEPLTLGELYEKLDSIVPSQQHARSYLENHKILFNIYGAYIFIGLFLGILFLMATGSIIYYKQMMEARDDQARYRILRKIGMTEGEVLLKRRRHFYCSYSL